MKNLLISSLFFFLSNLLIFGQNTNNLEQSLSSLNNKFNGKAKFSIISEQLILKIYSNNELIRTDKIYFDDLSPNGVFYDKEYKTITIKCASDYCVDRKLFKDRAKKIAQSSSIPVIFDDEKIKDIVSELRNVINEFHQQNLVVVDNTEIKQISDLTNHLISTNILFLAKKNLSVNYEYITNNNKIGIQIPLLYAFSGETFMLGFTAKFYKNLEPGLYKFGDLELGKGMTSFFIGPQILNWGKTGGNHISALADIGVSFQLANGFNLSSDFAIGGAKYYKIKTTVTDEQFLDYYLNINFGWRF